MTENDAGILVGERLRAIRRQKGLSLHDVEARSRQEFKASVVGAYERGERAISVARLLRLAELYDVPPDQFLPREPGEVEIDLVRLQQQPSPEPDVDVLARYAQTIQLQRQDFNGRMLTIRRDDVRVLAAVLGRRPEELASRLDDLGLRTKN